MKRLDSPSWYGPGDFAMSTLVYTIHGFAVFFFIFWFGVWCLHLIAFFWSHWKLNNKRTKVLDPEIPLPGVSIIKPLVGVDPNLHSNLETFFTSTYPKFELLFCVQDKTDPAITVVQNLLDKYPQVDARLFTESLLLCFVLKLYYVPQILNSKIYETLRSNLQVLPKKSRKNYRFLNVQRSSQRKFETIALQLLRKRRGILKERQVLRKVTRVQLVNLVGPRGGEKVGINPKINNMQPAYAAAKHELVLISDSGIRMKDDTVMDMVSFMGDKVGLVHQMPFVCDRSGFPAIIEKVYFGTSHARIYLAADCLGINCPTGMSALMRKKLLDEKGGIKAFGCYLAEDYFFAKSITDRGWKISISSQPAWQNSGFCDIPSFQARISRWAKLRFAMVPPTLLFEPFSECMMLGICAAFSTRILFMWDPIVVFLVHLLIWCIIDWFLLRSVQNGTILFSKFEYVLAWLFRETTAPFLFIHALLSPTIQWRQGLYRLHWGGLVEEISPKVKL